MFTVKFYSEPPDHNINGSLTIIEALEVEILPSTPHYDYFVRCTTKDGLQSRVVRFLTEEERKEMPFFEYGEAPVSRVIIENSSGKTTEIINAHQKMPPVALQADQVKSPSKKRGIYGSV